MKERERCDDDSGVGLAGEMTPNRAYAAQSLPMLL